MIGGIVFTTNKYTDNSIYNVSINKVKSYGVYLQPANSTLNRYCYMDNVMVWGFSDNTPMERWTGSVAFFWGNKAPDCECNNLVNMVCQVGFDCRTDVYGCNWTSYTGIPSGGTGGTDANNGGIAQSLARLLTMIFMLLTSMRILVSMLLSLMGRVKQQLILTI